MTGKFLCIIDKNNRFHTKRKKHSGGRYSGVAYLPSLDFQLDFQLDFRVRVFFGGVSNIFSVVLHNVLCQRCCSSS